MSSFRAVVKVRCCTFSVSRTLAYSAAEGVLKGYDALVNLVLDETVEFLRGQTKYFTSDEVKSLFVADPDDPYKITHDSRQLGLIVARGTTLTLVQPVDGTEQIANPFVQAE